MSLRRDANAALFVMLAQTAERTLLNHEHIASATPLRVSDTVDLAALLPMEVRAADRAAEAYKLFFVFESYLRDLVVDVLTDTTGTNWGDKLPQDVRDEVEKLEQTEEIKSWMALGSRDKSRLMTYPQLLRVIEHCWKDHFAELIRDKALVQEARLIAHLRNTICHMTEISEEEINRVRQTMRDWFRIVAP
ncbi:hypothetical protein K6V71_00610 [Cupriavidus gilardii]|uniref:Swt1 family HEPN domain-containing protein n=1 Tax=Cupriavidus gilardii TaxID=82541 RepID=UPI0021DA46A0